MDEDSSNSDRKLLQEPVVVERTEVEWHREFDDIVRKARGRDGELSFSMVAGLGWFF